MKILIVMNFSVGFYEPRKEDGWGMGDWLENLGARGALHTAGIRLRRRSIIQATQPLSSLRRAMPRRAFGTPFYPR